MSERQTTTPRDPADITALAIERRMTRRNFLVGAGAGLGAIALAGCAPTAASAPPATSAPSAAGPSGGASASASAAASANLGDSLTLATWPNYHDPTVLQDFTTATGVAINMQVFGSTEEMEAKIRAGNSGIDVVVPSNYAIEGWVKDTLIEKLDYAKLPDFKKEDWNPRFMDQAFDKGKTLIVDHQISSFGSAAVAMGYSLNTIDPTEMAAVEQMLTALKPNLFAISSDVQPPLRAKDTWLSVAWTGDGVQVVRDNPDDAKYVVASDGGELWIDSYTIAADAPHRDAAYAFLNWITQPAQAARETTFCLFPHANDKATALVDPAVKNNPVVYPPADSLTKLEYAVNATYNSPARAEAWARIKASA
jgi:spermidine/putrescine transport system substrate-binding protein